MPTLNRLHKSLVTCVVLAGGVAYAEGPTLTDPPNPNEAPHPACEAQNPQCPGQAQTPPPAYEAPPPPVAVEESHPWYEVLGFGISAGGGVSDFVGGNTKATTNTGGNWDVRLTLGT